MKTCDWCGRPESEQAIEPVVCQANIPMNLCEECRGVDTLSEGEKRRIREDAEREFRDLLP